jgi:hypothetical protein
MLKDGWVYPNAINQYMTNPTGYLLFNKGSDVRETKTNKIHVI